jgi:CubicO group peptidase (beta-lactamase class C family)
VLLEELVAARELSAVTASVLAGDEVAAEGAAGWADEAGGVAADLGTVYDLASLTKIVTASLALALHRRGDLPLEIEVGEVFAQAAPDLAGRALEDLLRHRSGLAAWAPLHALGEDPDEALDYVLRGSFPGVSEPQYSDLGYVVWGRAAERATGRPLASLFEEHLFRPLGMEGTHAVPGPRPEVAECRLDNGREVELAAGLGISVAPQAARRRGTPQDGNARYLGGLAGHAGLFGPLDDLLRLVAEWLAPGEVLDPSLVERALAGEGTYALGWWRPEAVPALAAACPRGSFGMLGFTGGTVWVDPARRRVAALLGHRIDSGRPAAEVRRRFLELGMGEMG